MPVEKSEKFKALLGSEEVVEETGRTPAHKFVGSNQPIQLQEEVRSLPTYMFPNGINIDTNGTNEDSALSGVYRPSSDPTTVGWYDGERNTLIHELEHVRQTFVGYPEATSDIGTKVPTGAIGDRTYWDIRKKLLELPKAERTGLYEFGANAFDNKDEMFANLTAYMYDNLAKGIEFTKTPLGKKLGYKKGSEELDYLYSRTMVGVDKIYERPKETSFVEKFQEFWKKRPQ